MNYPNEVFANMYRNFELMSNPFLEALKGGISSNTSEASGNPAGLPDTSEMAETVRQNLQDQVKLLSSITSSAIASSEKLAELNLNAARTSIQENLTLA